MEDALKEIVKYLGVFVAGMLPIWIKQLVDNYKKRKQSEAQFTVEFDLKVKNEENLLMRTYGPCRMFVYNFSNGDYMQSGLPLVKISMWHEVVEGHYVPYMSPHYQPPRLCPAMFNAMIKTCFDDGFYYLESKDDIKQENPPLYEFMTTWDICSVMLIAITDNSGNPKAILAMHWPRKKYRNDDELLKMRRDKNAIEKLYRGLKNAA